MGLKPITCRLEVCCSIQLSYAPICVTEGIRTLVNRNHNPAPEPLGHRHHIVLLPRFELGICKGLSFVCMPIPPQKELYSRRDSNSRSRHPKCRALDRLGYYYIFADPIRFEQIPLVLETKMLTINTKDLYVINCRDMRG